MYANATLVIIREKLVWPSSELGPKCHNNEGGKGRGRDTGGGRGGDSREK